MLKVATWNLGYGSVKSPSFENKEIVYEAIKHLASPDIGGDVLLAQEISAPASTESDGRNVFADIPKNKPKSWGGKKINDSSQHNWGTAVFLTHKQLNKIPLNFQTAYPGTIVVAKMDDIAFISMYGKAIYYEKKTQEFYLQNLHRCLSDLSSLFLYPDLQKKLGIKEFLIAGDWNIGPQFDRGNQMNANFFDRLACFGFKDCLEQNPTGKHHETLKGSSKQIDWMFATDGLIKAKQSASVKILPDNYSDHHPIIATFNI